jgi:hypothetical protein
MNVKKDYNKGTMDASEIQRSLFEQIKSKLPEPSMVAEVIAKLLDISTDSVYRRMRGEKAVTLEEVNILCNQYQISLDQLMQIRSNVFAFEGRFLDSKTFRFDAYLKNAHQTMSYMNSFERTEFFYLCKDNPFFHYFHFKEFAAFKYFFWMSTLMFFPEFKNKKVAFEEYSDEMFEQGKEILDIYNQMDSVEIWNVESLTSSLRQVDYYRDARRFKSDRDIYELYDAIEKMMTHLEKQAELGYKFEYGDPEKKPLGKFRMYFNEIVLGDNQMLAVIDDSKMVFIPHSAANYIMTRDPAFCEHFYQYLQNLMRCSTLISEVSEKERSKFFKIHRDRLAHRKQSLKV